jgi:deoxyribodipyrimidine photo-lyase
MKSLLWFRGDLRIHDNPALKDACIQSDEVHAVYIYSINQLEAHNDANVKIDFLIRNLFDLERNLSLLNIPLTIIKSNGYSEDPELILKLANKYSIKKVFWNSQFGENELVRDIKISKSLDKANIGYQHYHDQVIYDPGTLRTGQDTPYSVFTPFKRKWIENFEMDFLDIDFKYQRKTSSEITSNIKDFNFNLDQAHEVDMNLWPAGEQEADERLINFLNEKADDYSKNRNDPILDGTSRISPYLACGIISPKKCILEALKNK